MGIADSRAAIPQYASMRLFQGPVSGNVDLRLNPNPDEIIFDDTILPQGWQINEVTIATDAYTASQDLDAWYFGSELAYEWIKLSGGVRFEQSQQDVITFDIFDAERNPVISDLDTDDAFLSLNSTFIFGDHQVRLNYGETINRPDFKELSPSLYKDPTLERIVIASRTVAAYLVLRSALGLLFQRRPVRFPGALQEFAILSSP
jgi:outer membrane receptor protein involved in Fe transport